MSKIFEVQVEQSFAMPVERLFAHLSEHENMRPLFAPARVSRLTDGGDGRNGVGSARIITPVPMPSFIETVTTFRANELVEYRITKGSPLRNHRGAMIFRSLGPNRSSVRFDIQFEGRFPGAGPIFRFILNRGIKQGLKGLEREQRRAEQ